MVLYSDPPIIYVQLVDTKPELCLAYFNQTVSFDISEITDFLNPGNQLNIQFFQAHHSILITK